MHDDNYTPITPRESVWSIPHSWRAAYFFLFSIQTLTGVGLLSWYEVTLSDNNAIQNFLSIIAGAAQIGVGSAANTIAIMEVIQYIMVTVRYLEDRLVKPQRERLRSEGRTQVQEMWEAWNRRRMEAEAKGEPFDDSPPKLNDSDET